MKIALFCFAFWCYSPLVVAQQNYFQIRHLNGFWAESYQSNVSFIIKGDKIRYLEDATEYKIELLENRLKVSESGHLIAYYKVIKLDKNMLWLKLEEGNTKKYVRIRACWGLCFSLIINAL